MMKTVGNSFNSKVSCWIVLMSAAFLAAMTMPFIFNSIVTAKLIAFVIIVGLFIFSPFKIYSEYRLLFLTGLIFFPVTLTIGGKDTLTTATLAILGTMFLLLFKCLLKRSFEADKLLLIWMGVLLFIAATGVFRWHGINFAREVRHFINFFSSGILFLILVNAPGLCGYNRIAFAKKLLAVIVWLLAVHLLIGIAVYYWPDAGKLFSVFLVRTKDAVAVKTVDNYTRIASLICYSEGIGEIISVITPFIIFLAYEGKHKYWLAYGIMALGLLMANTRAGIILFVLANAAMLFVYRFRIKRSVARACAVIILCGIPLLFYQSHIVLEVFNRMSEIPEKIIHQNNIVEIFLIILSLPFNTVFLIVALSNLILVPLEYTIILNRSNSSIFLLLFSTFPSLFFFGLHQLKGCIFCLISNYCLLLQPN